jgi:nicotinate-nucleotide--dimethylbenzimidazole phosphoribosyltransferase
VLVKATVDKIRPLDRAVEMEAQRRLDCLTKPPGSLGKFEALARHIAVIQGEVPPRLGPKLLFVFAADHGITQEGVSAYPKEVTAQMTYNFLRGGAAINVLARHYGVDLKIIDTGVDHEFIAAQGLRNCKIRRGTDNFSLGQAMTREQARQSIETGIRLVEEVASQHPLLIGAGEMGIGSTSSAAAILCAFTGASPRNVVGRGTGIDDAALERKIRAIERGLELNRPDPTDPLDVLAKVGGLEIGAIAGVVLAAAAWRIPLVLDGFVCGAGALVAYRFSPSVREVLFASHLSPETGHRSLLKALDLAPLLQLEMRLGEGTGACLLMGLIEGAVKIMDEMATFESAGIRQRIS